MKKLIFLSIVIIAFGFSSSSYKIAVLKYYGGGDWYSNPTALNNLIVFCNENLGTNIDRKYDKAKAIVESESINLSDKEINYAQNKALSIIYS